MTVLHSAKVPPRSRRGCHPRNCQPNTQSARRSSARGEFWSFALLRSPKNYDAICIGALRVVLDSPAVCCFCELLLVDHHEQAFEGQSLRSLANQSLEKDFAIANLTNFKGDMPLRANNAGKLT